MVTLSHRAGLTGRSRARSFRPVVGRASPSLNEVAVMGDQARQRLSTHAGSLLSRRDRLCFPAVEPAHVRTVFPVNLPLHVCLSCPYSQENTDGFAHVQKVFAEIANV
ncbi:hypothetical protein MKK70_21400 [Methylobacterium sp. E-041]|uniref:hypothetical protein n=1 Tax=Methylobacterium sp. E-041 TaxID=2836573 RepID=UPI001FB8A392|nr:hypothetical protein [Methylobacterium sp. E-041]MCJ2107885.1 hypothetical protein [Methylobacterium sp. E-041]